MRNSVDLSSSLSGKLQILSVFVLLTALISACQQENTMEAVASDVKPHVAANSMIEAGRYLVIMGGCNDCHTDEYLLTEGQVPEEKWLAGSTIGFRGPWGTTYPPNLRLRAQEWSEETFVTTLKTRKALPPMPWMNVNQINEQDAKAIYQYIRSLGPTGEHRHAPVPPGEEPTTPYFVLDPQAPMAGE